MNHKKDGKVLKGLCTAVGTIAAIMALLMAFATPISAAPVEKTIVTASFNTSYGYLSPLFASTGYEPATATFDGNLHLSNGNVTKINPLNGVIVVNNTDSYTISIQPKGDVYQQDSNFWGYKYRVTATAVDIKFAGNSGTGTLYWITEEYSGITSTYAVLSGLVVGNNGARNIHLQGYDTPTIE